jgi:hypothetical protein
MPEIKSIKNITITQDFSATIDFYIKPYLLETPDECVIRGISYEGPTTDTSGIYLVWCDLINDFICSFAVDASTIGGTKLTHNINVCPQSRIIINTSSIYSQIHLKIFSLDVGNVYIPCTTLTGEFALTLEFVKYKK